MEFKDVLNLRITFMFVNPGYEYILISSFHVYSSASILQDSSKFEYVMSLDCARSNAGFFDNYLPSANAVVDVNDNSSCL